ncbi:hypothetical protein D3C72_1868930 [compost metagenome]
MPIVLEYAQVRFGVEVALGKILEQGESADRKGAIVMDSTGRWYGLVVEAHEGPEDCVQSIRKVRQVIQGA